MEGGSLINISLGFWTWQSINGVLGIGFANYLVKALVTVQLYSKDLLEYLGD